MKGIVHEGDYIKGTVHRTVYERDCTLKDLYMKGGYSILRSLWPPVAPWKVKTQAHITFYWMKIIKYSCYENYPEKLCDHEFLVSLTN